MDDNEGGNMVVFVYPYLAVLGAPRLLLGLQLLARTALDRLHFALLDRAVIADGVQLLHQRAGAYPRPLLSST